MVRRDIASAGLDGRDPVTDSLVLRAMGRVPRHEFVPWDLKNAAYEDTPLPIGQGQTISQPYMVGYMTQLLRPTRESVILEIGTGSGYQAAVLAEIVRHLYTLEIVPELAQSAATRLQRLGYTNITVRAGDGYAGWEEMAPFDGIIVTAAPDHIPPALILQLKPGGRLVLPVGPAYAVQSLTVVTKLPSGAFTQESVMPARFVPLRRQEGGVSGPTGG